MSMLEGPRTLLARLAPMSAAGWNALGSLAFAGELSIATDRSLYRLKDGLFLGRARLGEGSFDWPAPMRGRRLVGFLNDEGGLWSLSPRWRAGSHAVLWKAAAGTEEASFLLTSPTVEVTYGDPSPRPAQPEPAPSPWMARASSESGVRIRRLARPPSLRLPVASSVTRIHSAPAAASPS